MNALEKRLDTIETKLDNLLETAPANRRQWATASQLAATYGLSRYSIHRYLKAAGKAIRRINPPLTDKQGITRYNIEDFETYMTRPQA